MATLNSALRVCDFMIENAVEMLEEEERNQLDISHDISFEKRKNMTNDLINKVVHFARF